MGQPKQLIEYAGEPLVRRAARSVVEAGCSPVVVVKGSHTHEVQDAIGDIIEANGWFNRNWQKGMGSSIKSGIDCLSMIGGTPMYWRADNGALTSPPKQAGVLLHLCDQPLVDGTTLRRLIEAWRLSEKLVCISTWEGGSGPPVVIDASLLPLLHDLPDASGAKAIWSGHPEWVATNPCPAAAFDVDTPADLAALPHAAPVDRP